jgi:hypothetical protein
MMARKSDEGRRGFDGEKMERRGWKDGFEEQKNKIAKGRET